MDTFPCQIRRSLVDFLGFYGPLVLPFAPAEFKATFLPERSYYGELSVIAG
jgi:hypothetical protein